MGDLSGGVLKYAEGIDVLPFEALRRRSRGARCRLLVHVQHDPGGVFRNKCTQMHSMPRAHGHGRSTSQFRIVKYAASRRISTEGS